MFPSIDIRLKQSIHCRQTPKFPIQPPEGKTKVNISVLYLFSLNSFNPFKIPGLPKTGYLSNDKQDGSRRFALVDEVR